ncbi:acyltransferase family protein [Glacieibacterium frigidum]|uniref:Acyltransferase n=1 Tax=Glacieibacterium frigidum TaxID=2593303 RepID=A0A552UI58_9SPHN|nr:acyltransferase [Glacieibacterium frigidum]TRW17903.1 acyltransferase [Glacieibacterium frigidum]
MSLLGRRIAPEDLRHDGNIFTALRWLLASSVMISHGWDLTQPMINLDPTVPVLTLPISTLAVFLFFSLSGFLVTGSLAKRGVRDYAVARLLRLVPGLWVMLIVVALGLWVIFGDRPFGAYITHPETLKFLGVNASLLGNAYFLPGIFRELPVPGVNGSLWTIPQEVRCYIVLAIVGWLGMLASRRVLAIAFGLYALAHLALPLDMIPALERPRQLGFAFFLGVLAYQWRGSLRLSWPLALAGVGVALAVAHLLPVRTVGLAALQLGFGYLALVAAFAVPVGLKRASAAIPDYSYGIYIYAFPVQQTVMALGWGTTPVTNLLISFALVLPFAAASWHLVESPALRLKDRFQRRRA